jgi:hypothetical protein
MTILTSSVLALLFFLQAAPAANPVDQLPSIVSLAKLAGIVFTFATCFAAFCYGFYRTIQSERKKAQKAEKERNDEIESKIEKAVELERCRLNDLREADDERIKRLRETASEWKEIAQQKDMRNQLLIDDLGSVRLELKELKEKYETLVGLYTESQRMLSSLTTRLSHLERPNHGDTQLVS